MRFESLLLWAVPAVQLVLLSTLLRRKLYRWRQLPFFFLYTLFSIIAIVSRYIAAGHGSYFGVYWITEAVYNILALLVIWEIFSRIFEQEYEQHRWFWTVLPGTALFVATLCILEAVRHPLDSRMPLPEAIIYWSDLGVHGLEAAIWCLYLVLRRPLAAPSNRYEAGILTGFGVAACVSVIAFLSLFEFGAHSVKFFRYGPPIGYAVATVIWLAAFWHPPKPHPKTDLETLRRLANFVKHPDNANNELKHALT